MRMRQLQCFVVLAEELSFTRAAQRLNMSQPPLSTQIQTLERELGVELINRTSRKVALTRAGKLFRQYATNMLVQYERSLQEMREIHHGQEGLIEIGTTGSILRGGLSELLSNFAQAYPQITLRIHEQSPQTQIDEVRRRRTDVSFNRSIPHGSELAYEHAWQEELVALVRSDHKLAGRTSISMTDLKDDPFVILQPESSDFAAYVMSYVVASGYRPRISQQVIDAQSIPSLIAAGFGVSIVPAGIAHLTSGPLVFLPIRPDPPVSDIYMIYHADDPAPALQLFLTRVCRELNSTCSGRKVR
ncbi:LysR family transcriptional regulator [Brucella cytisi]|uniref:LysR family transcriptional regulator n=1 Tax=Brucella cytisi TaxID=407152 RepID=A0A1J6HVU2_9HYPH|nr:MULTISPECIES: LysR family transcriptional regulator [Brucella/Ochrobactrum group]EXL01849.1 LysR family transcriptional regulator [Brucella anthropi]KIU70379.1 LysR family transcriptional regulator [Brucella anthropi]MBA8862786.1 DNA-binding transcriptional LysR family regulator [Brucella anthropi]OIS92319.1 LysR family transcriptional regulator [Brucella cytisi]